MHFQLVACEQCVSDCRPPMPELNPFEAMRPLRFYFVSPGRGAWPARPPPYPPRDGPDGGVRTVPPARRGPGAALARRARRPWRQAARRQAARRGKLTSTRRFFFRPASVPLSAIG
ncbi:hypothetical protein GCM10023324_18740 [Streptomyces youssoufiensis]